MLSRIFSEHFNVSIGNKHNYKTFTKSTSVTFLENVLNHSSGKCQDSLTTAALSVTKSTCTIFIHKYLLKCNYQLEKKMIPIPLFVFHPVQAFGTGKGFVNLITEYNNCVSFNFTKFLRFSKL